MAQAARWAVPNLIVSVVLIGATLVAMAFNLTRAAARIASKTLGRARTSTVRRTLIQVAARIANQARTWLLHLPRDWPWEPQLATLYNAAFGPPAAAT